MRLWPPSFSRLIYDLLCVLWLRRKIPRHWKHRLLTPLPKVPGSELLTDLRPITLYECLRKIWTRLVVAPIQAAWERHNILSDSQYGFRPGRSTTSAILHLLNHIEDAVYTPAADHRLYIVLWDISKAFDSVHKSYLRAAWGRLGVPPAVCEWLVDLDEGGSVCVNSPYSHHFPPAPTFTTDRGVGQGDVQSPIIWAGFFDILLRALEIGRSPSDTHSTSLRIADPAFADDLATLARSLQHLQAKADIVSAFATLFNLQLSVKKLQLLSFSGQPKPLMIHTSKWMPHQLILSPDKEFRYLGLHIDLTYSGHFQFHQADRTARSICSIIKLRKASVATKYAVARSVAMSKIFYTGQLAPYTLQQYRLLDIPFHDLLRHATRNLQGFPTRLLYLPIKYGGLGFTRFSHLIQIQK